MMKSALDLELALHSPQPDTHSGFNSSVRLEGIKTAQSRIYLGLITDKLTKR